MSKIFSGILGTLAVSLSLGAAQYASGSDLVGLARQSTAVAPQATPQATINREAKTDRADAPANAVAELEPFPSPSMGSPIPRFWCGYP